MIERTPQDIAQFNADMRRIELRERLSAAFGSEWFALSSDDKALIVRDCTEDGGVSDIRRYRRDIGTGNLLSYVKTQRVRFAPKGGK